MKAYIFPGQGSQFKEMGKDFFEQSEEAQALFAQADEILGFSLSKVMFEGSAEDLKETKVTQPAIFLHSIITSRLKAAGIKPDVVAGHSLGEFSALVANGVLEFEDGLRLVSERALAMQAACEQQESTMAAVLGLDDEVVENICTSIDEIVVPANYNCPGQLVISGSIPGIEAAVAKLTEAGARRALVLQVGGAFHSPLMASAKDRLKAAIEATTFKAANCPIYQNVNALPTVDPDEIRQNLIDQLTAPVRWTQTVQNMLKDGVTNFVEVGGSGKVLRGMIRRIDRKAATETL